jgi:hypothetical protein
MFARVLSALAIVGSLVMAYSSALAASAPVYDSVITEACEKHAPVIRFKTGKDIEVYRAHQIMKEGGYRIIFLPKGLTKDQVNGTWSCNIEIVGKGKRVSQGTYTDTPNSDVNDRITHPFLREMKASVTPGS